MVGKAAGSSSRERCHVLATTLAIPIGEDMKKAITRTGGRRGAKIRVTTVGKPPLSAAEAFARLLLASHNKNPIVQESQEGGKPARLPRPDK